MVAVACTVTAWCPRTSRIGSAQRARVEAHNEGPTKWSRFSNLWVRRVYLRRTGSSGVTTWRIFGFNFHRDYRKLLMNNHAAKVTSRKVSASVDPNELVSAPLDMTLTIKLNRTI